MRSQPLKLLCCAAMLLPLISLVPCSVLAEGPASGEGPGGSVAAENTELDRSAYVDGSVYDNPAPELELVRIGLDYGDGALEEAWFENSAGQGFLIVYDEDRTFRELARTGESLIRIGCPRERLWQVLLEETYESARAAKEAADVCGGSVRETDEGYQVLYGAFSTRSAAMEAAEEGPLPGRAYTQDPAGLCVTKGRGGEFLFMQTGAQPALAVFPLGDGSTWHGGELYRGGFLCRFDAFGGLTVINYVGLEDYVKGVIPYEMNYNWPYEALRAQAVCARTYVVYNQGQYEDQGFDITDDTYSQVYRGLQEANETTDRAVDSTAGQYVRYEGEICEIYYSAADGGATEDGRNVFDADRPYLTGKIDPYEGAVDFSLKTWSIQRSGEAIAARLLWDGIELGPVTGLLPKYSDTGNVIAIRFSDADRNRVWIKGRRCYTILGLNSPHFTVTEDENGGFTFNGGGLGHSCGMSQWGAYAMASVYGYDYEDIIRFYFTGAYIA